MVFTENRDLALKREFGEYQVMGYRHYDLICISTDDGDYVIGTDDEADSSWRKALNYYLEESIYPELPENLVYYFDDKKWIKDAEQDGRGHALSSYDGEELEILDLYAYRIN